MAGELDWLEIDTEHGCVLPSETLDFTLNCSAGEHPEGEYQGRIHLYTNDPDRVHTSIPVVMVISTSQQDSTGGVPVLAILSQNYPNPFNGATSIQYDLPSETDVKIDIYGLHGVHITTLVKERQAKGYHEVSWDPVNIPSGVYFYRIKTGDHIETRRLTLLK